MHSLKHIANNTTVKREETTSTAKGGSCLTRQQAYQSQMGPARPSGLVKPPPPRGGTPIPRGSDGNPSGPVKPTSTLQQVDRRHCWPHPRHGQPPWPVHALLERFMLPARCWMAWWGFELDCLCRREVRPWSLVTPSSPKKWFWVDRCIYFNKLCWMIYSLHLKMIWLIFF
jgi:hypothetical protein